jgi:hypothetical protein
MRAQVLPGQRPLACLLDDNVLAQQPCADRPPPGELAGRRNEVRSRRTGSEHGVQRREGWRGPVSGRREAGSRRSMTCSTIPAPDIARLASGLAVVKAQIDLRRGMNGIVIAGVLAMIIEIILR